MELAVINVLAHPSCIRTVIDPDHRVAGSMTAAEFTKELLEQTGKDEKKEKGK